MVIHVTSGNNQAGYNINGALHLITINRLPAYCYTYYSTVPHIAANPDTLRIGTCSNLAVTLGCRNVVIITISVVHITVSIATTSKFYLHQPLINTMLPIYMWAHPFVEPNYHQIILSLIMSCVFEHPSYSTLPNCPQTDCGATSYRH